MAPSSLSRRLVAGLVALFFALTLPFGSGFAASGSSTNAGKLARSATVSRRAGGRVVRRNKARASSRRASKKRTSKRSAAKRRVAKKRRVTRKRSGKRIARTLRKSKRRASTKRRAATKRRARPTARMAKVDRGPVEPKLIKAAYTAKKNGRLLSRAPFECIPDELKAVLGQVAERWGTVVVNSSHRSKAHNRRVGGKSRSFHLKCEAADFSVAGSHKGLVAFLRKHPLVGGYKRYPAGHFHIDVGPKRSW